jgi:hypothetical protein
MMGESQVNRQAGTDAEGWYSIDELPADTYFVVVQIEGLMSSVSVQVSEGRVARVDFDIPAGTGVISGTVSRPENFELPMILVRDASDTEPFSMENAASIFAQALAMGSCKSDGSFEIANLPAGSYNVSVISGPRDDEGGFAVVQTSQTVTVEPGEVVELNFDL